MRLLWRAPDLALSSIMQITSLLCDFDLVGFRGRQEWPRSSVKNASSPIPVGSAITTMKGNAPRRSTSMRSRNHPRTCHLTRNPNRKLNECNGDITPIDTIPYWSGRSDKFLFADHPRTDYDQITVRSMLAIVGPSRERHKAWREPRLRSPKRVPLGE